MLPVQPSLALELLPILREELVYVVHSNHPLAAKQIIHPQDILEVPFISFLQGSAMQMNPDTFCCDGNSRTHHEWRWRISKRSRRLYGLTRSRRASCLQRFSHTGNDTPPRIRGFRMERELALALPKATALPQTILRSSHRALRKEYRAKLSQRSAQKPVRLNSTYHSPPRDTHG